MSDTPYFDEYIANQRRSQRIRDTYFQDINTRSSTYSYNARNSNLAFEDFYREYLRGRITLDSWTVERDITRPCDTITLTLTQHNR